MVDLNTGVVAATNTLRYGLPIPALFGDRDTWAQKISVAFNTIDALLFTKIDGARFITLYATSQAPLAARVAALEAMQARIIAKIGPV